MSFGFGCCKEIMMSTAMIYTIAFLFAVIFGAIIGLLIEPQCKPSINTISKEEYKKFLSQSQLASSSQRVRKLCPNKDAFELIEKGSNHSSFKFPPIDF